MDVVALIERHGGNVSAAAREAGIDRGTLARRLAAAGVKPGETKTPKATEKIERREAGDALALEYCGRKIRTVAQLVKAAGIDLAIWEVADVTANAWEVGGKRKHGRGKPETLWAMPLHQIKVRLRRRAPKPIQEGIRALLARGRPSAPPAVRHRLPSNGDAHMVEIALHDAHFGKLCWGRQTGTPYDLQIAAADFSWAMEDMLERTKGFRAERYLLPIGHDFFQANNWMGTTARGTVVDNVDDRFQKVFRVGCEAVERAILKLRESAPVEVVWIPGNHDPETSWYLVEWLGAVFRKDRHVTIDNSAPQRKYRAYGPALLGMTHGEIKHDRLPLLMAKEAKALFGAASQHAWHVGHLHKKAETSFNAGNTFNGVTVTVIPSISGTDSWHYEQGFVENERRAEAYLWGKADGYVGHFSVLARSSRKAA